MPYNPSLTFQLKSILLLIYSEFVYYYNLHSLVIESNYLIDFYFLSILLFFIKVFLRLIQFDLFHLDVEISIIL